MKKLFVFVLVASFAITLQAQHVFNKGSIMFNAGLGAPNNFGYIPTLNFSGEVGVIPTGDIGLVSFGGMVEFQFAQYSYGYLSNNENFARFYFGPRAAWHVHAFDSDLFDAYAGVGAGIIINGESDNIRSSTEVHPDIFAGGRWMFAQKMGLFAEVGYTGLSFLKFGVTFGL